MSGILQPVSSPRSAAGHSRRSASSQGIVACPLYSDCDRIVLPYSARTPCDGLSKPTNQGRIVAQCFVADLDVAACQPFQSSSSSRVTAAWFAFLVLRHLSERPA